jgi:DNA repair protein RadC
VGEVFRDAVKRNCAAIIVAHNHPSGDPTPSPEDVEVTRQLVAAGDLLDVEVLDHLIIGQHRFVSLRERGLGFT